MRYILAITLLVARAASAHDVPVSPNTCAFDLEIGAAVVAPPTDADALTIVYTVASNLAQFQAGGVPARGFTVDGVVGSVAFPTVFTARIVTSGDLEFAPVPLSFMVGGTPVTVTVPLTTGLVRSTIGGVVAGSPLGVDGAVALAGVIPSGALPPPLSGETRLRMECQLLPNAPDLDQFGEASAVVKLGGYVKPTKGKLHALLQIPSGTTIDFTRPAIFSFVVTGSQLILIDLPDGLVGDGKKFSGTASDGSVVTVKRGKQKARPTYKVLVMMPGRSVEPPPGGQAEVQATFQVGGVVARGARRFKAKSGGLRAT